MIRANIYICRITSSRHPRAQNTTVRLSSTNGLTRSTTGRNQLHTQRHTRGRSAWIKSCKLRGQRSAWTATEVNNMVIVRASCWFVCRSQYTGGTLQSLVGRVLSPCRSASRPAISHRGRPEDPEPVRARAFPGRVSRSGRSAFEPRRGRSVQKKATYPIYAPKERKPQRDTKLTNLIGIQHAKTVYKISPKEILWT